MLLVKLKNFQTSACLNLNYVTTKQNKKVKSATIMELVKLEALTSLILVIFQLHSFLPLPPFFLIVFAHKMLSGENGYFSSAW